MSNKYTYYLTPLAEQDIDSALDYITIQLCNGQAAIALLDKIESTIDTACAFPFSFDDCKCYLIDDKNIRHVPIENFVLIYEIKEEAKHINVLRFKAIEFRRTEISAEFGKATDKQQSKIR